MGEDLEAIRKACADYANAAAFIDVGGIVGKQPFNGDAVKALAAYDETLRQFHLASHMMGEEHLVLDEFKAAADVSRIKAPTKIMAWHAGSRTDAEGREMGALVSVRLPEDDKGNPKYKQEPVKVPEGMKLAEGVPTHYWTIQVEYPKPELVGGKKDAWVDTRRIFLWDLRNDVAEVSKGVVEKHHEVYRKAMLGRLYRRIDALATAARNVAPARERALKKLGELAHENE